MESEDSLPAKLNVTSLYVTLTSSAWLILIPDQIFPFIAFWSFVETFVNITVISTISHFLEAGSCVTEETYKNLIVRWEQMENCVHNISTASHDILTTHITCFICILDTQGKQCIVGISHKNWWILATRWRKYMCNNSHTCSTTVLNIYIQLIPNKSRCKAWM